MVYRRGTAFKVMGVYRTLDTKGTPVVLRYLGNGTFEDTKDPNAKFVCDLRELSRGSQCAIHPELEAFFSSKRAVECTWLGVLEDENGRARE